MWDIKTVSVVTVKNPNQRQYGLTMMQPIIGFALLSVIITSEKNFEYLIKQSMNFRGKKKY